MYVLLDDIIGKTAGMNEIIDVDDIWVTVRRDPYVVYIPVNDIRQLNKELQAMGFRFRIVNFTKEERTEIDYHVMFNNIKYIAKDLDNTVWAYEEKPTLTDGVYHSREYTAMLKCKYDFLPAGGIYAVAEEEPVSITKLLEEDM